MNETALKPIFIVFSQDPQLSEHLLGEDERKNRLLVFADIETAKEAGRKNGARYLHVYKRRGLLYRPHKRIALLTDIEQADFSKIHFWRTRIRLNNAALRNWHTKRIWTALTPFIPELTHLDVDQMLYDMNQNVYREELIENVHWDIRPNVTTIAVPKRGYELTIRSDRLGGTVELWQDPRIHSDILISMQSVLEKLPLHMQLELTVCSNKLLGSAMLGLVKTIAPDALVRIKA